MPDPKKDSKISRACDDFNAVSRIKVPDVETFQKLVSLSPKVRNWYADWSFENAAFSTMPGSFRTAGVTPEQWSEISSVLPKINSIRKRVSSEIAEEAAKFDRFIEVKEEEAAAELAELENAYVKILKVNITCLSLEDQLSILAQPEAERKDFEKLKLEDLRAKLLKDLSNNQFEDPFVYGDFKDLLV